VGSRQVIENPDGAAPVHALPLRVVVGLHLVYFAIGMAAALAARYAIQVFAGVADAAALGPRMTGLAAFAVFRLIPLGLYFLGILVVRRRLPGNTPLFAGLQMFVLIAFNTGLAPHRVQTLGVAAALMERDLAFWLYGGMLALVLGGFAVLVVYVGVVRPIRSRLATSDRPPL